MPVFSRSLHQMDNLTHCNKPEQPQFSDPRGVAAAAGYGIVQGTFPKHFWSQGLFGMMQYWMSSCHWEISTKVTPQQLQKHSREFGLRCSRVLSLFIAVQPGGRRGGGRKQTALLWQEGTVGPSAITCFPRASLAALAQSQINSILGQVSESSYSLPSVLRPGQVPAFPWHRRTACVSFTLWLQPCNLYSERDAAFGSLAAFVWLLSVQLVQSTVAREVQQTQLEVMSRRGVERHHKWKAWVKLVIETLQDTLKLLCPLRGMRMEKRKKFSCYNVSLWVSVHFHMMIPLILPRGKDPQVGS